MKIVRMSQKLHKWATRVVTHIKTMPDDSELDILKLIQRVKDRPVKTISFEDIKGFNRSKRTGFSKKRYEETDPKYPGIVDGNNFLLDGRHRIYKQMNQGKTKGEFIVATDKDIKAVTI